MISSNALEFQTDFRFKLPRIYLSVNSVIWLRICVTIRFQEPQEQPIIEFDAPLSHMFGREDWTPFVSGFDTESLPFLQYTKRSQEYLRRSTVTSKHTLEEGWRCPEKLEDGWLHANLDLIKDQYVAHCKVQSCSHNLWLLFMHLQVASLQVSLEVLDMRSLYKDFVELPNQGQQYIAEPLSCNHFQKPGGICWPAIRHRQRCWHCFQMLSPAKSAQVWCLTIEWKYPYAICAQQSRFVWWPKSALLGKCR